MIEALLKFKYISNPYKEIPKKVKNVVYMISLINLFDPIQF